MPRRQVIRGLALGAGLAALFLCAPSVRATQSTLPASIPDREFWSLIEQMSEPNGHFQSDNFTSNEMTLSTVAVALAARVKPGGVYLGVGPEQNFTYIAAIRPRIAFITDIRRGNLHMHLMYKALFELSADRADFVSRLFSRSRPAGLTTASTAADLMNAYWDIQMSDEATYKANLQEIKDVLVKEHGFPLSAEDLAGIEYVYHGFYWHGLRISYGSRSTGVTSMRGTNYADLMMTIDSAGGGERSYLSSEASFAFLKALEARNLLVPVVGDFAGPKALRAVGKHIRDHGAVVTAFYLSNVEQYLTRNGVWPAFCANVATMPLDEGSTFIRPSGAGRMITFTVNGAVTGRGTPTLLNGVPITQSMVMLAGGRRGSPFGTMATEVAGCTGWQ